MITFLKACVASFVSKEMAACKTRYNNKCAEVRKLTEQIARNENEFKEFGRTISRLEAQIQTQKSESSKKDLLLEEQKNQITLTDMIVEQQFQIIKRDLEMRRLEHVDASIRTRMASAMAGQEAKEGPKNGVDESDINYRPGR